MNPGLRKIRPPAGARPVCVRSRTGRPWLGRRLLVETGGQVLLIGLIVVAMLLVFMLVIPGGTQVGAQKLRAQTAADAGAFTGSVWVARALNLNANMNIGISSVYTWMTVLTMGSALALALQTAEGLLSVTDMSKDLSYALFGNNDPTQVTAAVYPSAISSLAETAGWLSALQDDIADIFPELAGAMGTLEATRNASRGDPSSTNPAGKVRVLTDSATPMLVENSTGDNLLYSRLRELANSLESIPTGDTNIGPATGIIIIDTASYEIKAYYGAESMWLTLKQGLCGQRRVNQWYHMSPEIPRETNYLYESWRYFNDHNAVAIDSACGKSWLGPVHWWFIDSLKQHQPLWRVYGKKSYAIPHPGDTLWVHMRLHQFGGEPGSTGLPPPDTALDAYPYVLDSGYDIVYSWLITEFYSGADSTRGNQGPKLRPRRLNPDRDFHAVSFAWNIGSNSSPRGPGPQFGGALVPRSKVAAPSPMLTVARSIPYLAIENPTDDDYFFSPNWDAKLTPLDSLAVQDIYDDPDYAALGLYSLNLEELRKYVLLP